MKNKLIFAAVLLIFLGTTIGFMGYRDYEFSKQPLKNISDMMLEDYEEGQRISANIYYAYDSYAETRNYNTIYGIKTTKSKTKDRHYLVPMLYASEDEEDYIAYFLSFIVPENQRDDFEQMVSNFWGNPSADFKVSFHGKVVEMTDEVEGILKEYLSSVNDPEGNPGVTEYQYLINSNWLEDVSTEADIDERFVKYCIKYHSESAGSTGKILFIVGSVAAVLGIALIIGYFVSVKKKASDIEDSID